jgi:hypothetical protein
MDGRDVIGRSSRGRCRLIGEQRRCKQARRSPESYVANTADRAGRAPVLGGLEDQNGGVGHDVAVASISMLRGGSGGGCDRDVKPYAHLLSPKGMQILTSPLGQLGRGVVPRMYETEVLTAMTASDRSTAIETVLVTALASGATQAEAAAAAGISERTVRRRLERQDLARRVVEERSRLVTHTAARLTGLTGSAVDALMDLLADDVPPTVRLRASLGVLEAARIWRECSELEERITAIEAEVLSEWEAAR